MLDNRQEKTENAKVIKGKSKQTQETIGAETQGRKVNQSPPKRKEKGRANSEN